MTGFHRGCLYRLFAILFCGLFIFAACNKKSTNGDIIILDPPEPPVHTPALDWSASWNPTNNKIAYIHYENDTTNTVYPTGIYVMEPDGSNRIRIFLSRRIIHIDWSPDGRWVVANEHGYLLKISYPDGFVDTLLRGSEYYYPAWSPDGSKIACVLREGSMAGIYTLYSDGSDYRLLIPGGDYPAWYSADSILYLNLDYELQIGSICISNASGSYKRLVVQDTSCGITRFNNINSHLNKKRIAALTVIPGDSIYIYTYDIQQNDLRRFLPLCDYPDFSPDGDSIIYTDIREGYYNLNVICWDGTGARQVTAPVSPEGGGL